MRSTPSLFIPMRLGSLLKLSADSKNRIPIGISTRESEMKEQPAERWKAFYRMGEDNLLRSDDVGSWSDIQSRGLDGLAPSAGESAKWTEGALSSEELLHDLQGQLEAKLTGKIGVAKP